MARRLLESDLPAVWISGEISNLARPASGHWYFSLKDEQAQVRAVMFRGANRGVRFAPATLAKALFDYRYLLPLYGVLRVTDFAIAEELRLNLDEVP